MIAGLGLTRAAAAQPLKVAVLPFNGPQGARVASEIARPLKSGYDVLPESQWNASAKKLVATSHSAEDIAAVAGDLGVAVVVTGAIKKEPGWTLIVTVRNAQTGKPVDKLRYEMKSSKVPKSVLKQVESELPPLIDKAQAPPQEAKPEEPAGETPTSEMPTGGTENENPLAQPPPPPPTTAERPVWLPLVTPNVGFILGGRSFSFDQDVLPAFHSTVVFGVRLDATVNPLALLVKDPNDKTMNALAGLGIGVTYDYLAWPDSQPSVQNAMNCGTKTVPCQFGTSEYRLEVGLRWHWNMNMNEKKPELLAEVQYGRHDFSIEKKKDPMSGVAVDVGPPDVTYSYVTLGLGGKYPIHPQFSLLGQFNFHILTDAGAIQSQAEYGPGGGYGLRIAAGGESKVWKNLVVRLLVYYEYFGLSFDSDPNKPAGAVMMGTPAPKSSSDSFYGGILTAGWSY